MNNTSEEKRVGRKKINDEEKKVQIAFYIRKKNLKKFIDQAVVLQKKIDKK